MRLPTASVHDPDRQTEPPTPPKVKRMTQWEGRVSVLAGYGVLGCNAIRYPISRVPYNLLSIPRCLELTHAEILSTLTGYSSVAEVVYWISCCLRSGQWTQQLWTAGRESTVVLRVKCGIPAQCHGGRHHAWVQPGSLQHLGENREQYICSPNSAPSLRLCSADEHTHNLFILTTWQRAPRYCMNKTLASYLPKIFPACS